MPVFLSIGEAMIEMSAAPDGLWRMGFAGDTLNTAIYARSFLPAEWNVSYFTAIGMDRYSQGMKTFIASRGVETDRILTVEGKRPGLYFIHQDAGDRHFTYWRDSSAARLLADDEGALRAASKDASLLYFSGITLAILDPSKRERLLSILSVAREEGAQVCFDPNVRPALWPNLRELREALEQAASVSDVVLPTFSDETEIFNESDIRQTRDRYAHWGAREIVVKNGSEASLASTNGLEDFVTPAAVNVVVDTTGAGDSFNGAYLAHRARGVSMHEAVKAGHATAAICIGHQGALVPSSLLGRRIEFSSRRADR